MTSQRLSGCGGGGGFSIIVPSVTQIQVILNFPLPHANHLYAFVVLYIMFIILYICVFCCLSLDAPSGGSRSADMTSNKIPVLGWGSASDSSGI